MVRPVSWQHQCTIVYQSSMFYVLVSSRGLPYGIGKARDNRTEGGLNDNDRGLYLLLD